MQIEIQNLACGYHGQAVIKNINVQIGGSQMWCVLGANGVGKTTFFKTLLGLYPPISGHILLNGKALSGWKRKELAKQIAYVPQSHTPPFAFTVREVIAMGRNPHQQGLGRLSEADAAIVAEAISTLGLTALQERSYNQISGGERQLTLIARAIAQQTPVLVLDEPVANLDFGNQARVLAHVSDLVQKLNKTVIMTTHSPDHGLAAETNVLLLYKNKDCCAGKGREIITQAAIKELYQIENQIIHLEHCGKTICVSL